MAATQEQYYVIRKDSTASLNLEYLYSISQNFNAFQTDYEGGMQIPTATMAEEFKNWCEYKEPDATFTVVHVEITLTDVNSGE